MEPEVGKKYVHYKGGEPYTVFAVVTHTETNEKMVVYGKERPMWTRPLSIWNEKVGNVNRFTETRA